jgi:hypothetical protein
MPRQEVNRSGEMEVFVRAVELGGFQLASYPLGEVAFGRTLFA